MKVFADNLRTRAQALGLANAEVARRAQIAERTFANYVLGRTEPNLDALVRICRALQCSADELINPSPSVHRTQRAVLLDRVRSGIEALSDDDLVSIDAQIGAVLKVRKRTTAD